MYLKYDIKDIFESRVLSVDDLLNEFEVDTYEKLILILYHYSIGKPYKDLTPEEKRVNKRIECLIEQLLTNYDIDVNALLFKFNKFAKIPKKKDHALTIKILRNLFYRKSEEKIALINTNKKLYRYLMQFINNVNNIEDLDNPRSTSMKKIFSYLSSFNFSNRQAIENMIGALKCIKQLTTNKIKEFKLLSNAKHNNQIKYLEELLTEIDTSLSFFVKKLNYIKDFEKLLQHKEAEEKKAKEIFQVRTFKDKKVNKFVEPVKLLVPKYVDIITIDDDDSYDLDDAVFLEHDRDGNYLVHVFITDVATSLDHNPQVDKEAYRRATSVYFPYKTFHMLGDFLATDHLSLVQGKKRVVFEHIVTLDEHFQVIKYDVRKAQIQVKKRMDYDEVNRIIQSGDEEDKLQKMIHELNLVANNLRSLSNRSDNCHEINPKAKPNSSYNIISELAILTNRNIAETFYNNGYPYIYRNHVLGNDAYYSNVNIGHDSLNLKAYSHSTSPIRRYVDVVNERLTEIFLLGNHLSDKECYEIEELISYDCQNLNESNRLAKVFGSYYSRVRRNKF